MEAAAKTWTGEWYKYGGGGPIWDGMAYDPDENLLYVGTGNGLPWPQDIRQGKTRRTWTTSMSRPSSPSMPIPVS